LKVTVGPQHINILIPVPEDVLVEVRIVVCKLAIEMYGLGAQHLHIIAFPPSSQSLGHPVHPDLYGLFYGLVSQAKPVELGAIALELGEAGSLDRTESSGKQDRTTCNPYKLLSDPKTLGTSPFIGLFARVRLSSPTCLNLKKAQR
jgi:hypothetical protein